MPHLSLYELNTLVRNVIDQSFRSQYWVEAELAEASERRGHLYLNLIQKDERSNTPVAQARAVCWSSNWALIRNKFERVTGQQIARGMKVLLQVYPSFHQAYGFQWVVTDIDATYTLGDMARRRQEIIDILKEEGVFDMQKQLTLPLFAQHIAVISSATAAGYGDFCNQLADNEYGFAFHTQLFPAIMQGEKVEETIIAALDRIMEVNDAAIAYRQHPSPNTQSPSPITRQPTTVTQPPAPFDCVVIIRGGGATSDMSGFDTLALAENVANFPLPIITGIGHDRDESILDMISFQRVKTPTAAAAFLIDNLAAVSNVIDDMATRMAHAVQQKLEHHRVRLASMSSRLPVLFSLVKTQQGSHLDKLMYRLQTAMSQKTLHEQNRMEMLTQRIPVITANIMQKERHRIELLSQRTASLDPQLILRRGYSMTLAGGHVVTDVSKLMDGEVLETRLANGSVLSKVLSNQDN